MGTVFGAAVCAGFKVIIHICKLRTLIHFLNVTAQNKMPARTEKHSKQAEVQILPHFFW